MSDRELLELAARAAGHCMDYMRWDGYRFVEQKVHGVPHCGLNYEKTWNPLTDDGDALRLATALSISIEVNGMFVHADCRHCAGGDIGYFEENSARNDGDINKATRRAIVRASASVGEAMQ